MSYLSKKFLQMRITVLFVLGVLINVYCQTSGNSPEVGKTIEKHLLEIKNQFAPDKRVAIWNVTTIGRTPVVIRGETNLSNAKDALLQKLESARIKVIDSLRVLNATSALVNISVCNIRSLPKHSAELATQSLMGTPLRVYKQQNGWYYVQTPEGYLGWLDNGGLVLTGETSMRQWLTAEKLVVQTAFSLVRSAVDRAVISDVSEGNILQKLDVQGEYFRVALPDGRTGLVEKEVVTSYDDFVLPREPLHENIVSTAKNFLGRPYLWGGTSGKAMDCSGFTKTVYYLNGLVLPRDASQQVHVGMEIETDTTLRNLLPGDFLFFGRKANKEQAEKITHVGIYLGEGKMIHASEMVRVQSLRRGDANFAEHRLKTFVRAKRMLENIGMNGVIKLEDHPLYVPN